MIDEYGRGGTPARMENETIVEPRCEACNKLLARVVTSPWVIECRGCKTVNSVPG